MFVMSKALIDALAQSAREAFEDRMYMHVHKRFPNRCARLGEQKVRQRIREGMQRAEHHGMRRITDIAQFIRFMFVIHHSFDTCVRTRWAGSILRDTNLLPEERLEKIRQLGAARTREQRQQRARSRMWTHQAARPTQENLSGDN